MSMRTKAIFIVFALFIGTIIIIPMSYADSIDDTINFYMNLSLFLNSGILNAHFQNLTADQATFLNVTIINATYATGNITAPWFNGAWNGSSAYVTYANTSYVVKNATGWVNEMLINSSVTQAQTLKAQTLALQGISTDPTITFNGAATYVSYDGSNLILEPNTMGAGYVNVKSPMKLTNGDALYTDSIYDNAAGTSYIKQIGPGSSWSISPGLTTGLGTGTFGTLCLAGSSPYCVTKGTNAWDWNFGVSELWAYDFHSSHAIYAPNIMYANGTGNASFMFKNTTGWNNDLLFNASLLQGQIVKSTYGGRSIYFDSENNGLTSLISSGNIYIRPGGGTFVGYFTNAGFGFYNDMKFTFGESGADNAWWRKNSTTNRMEAGTTGTTTIGFLENVTFDKNIQAQNITASVIENGSHIVQFLPNSNGSTMMLGALANYQYSTGVGAVFFNYTKGNPVLAFCGNKSFTTNKIGCGGIFYDMWGRLVFVGGAAVFGDGLESDAAISLGANGALYINRGGALGIGDYGILASYSSGNTGINAIRFVGKDERSTNMGNNNYYDPTFLVHAKGANSANGWNTYITHTNTTGVIGSGNGNLTLNATNTYATNINASANVSGSLFYGGMFNFTDAGYVFSIASTGTYYNITNQQTGERNGVTITSSTTQSSFKVQYAGVYQVIGSMSSKQNMGTGSSYGFGMSIINSSGYYNPEQVAKCYSRLDGITTYQSQNFNCLLRLNAGDIIFPQIDDEGGAANNLNIVMTNFNILRIGN